MRCQWSRFGYRIIVVCVFVSNRLITHFSFWISLSFHFVSCMYIYFHFWLGILVKCNAERFISVISIAFFYPDLFFFPTIGARFCIFVPCIGFFLSVCGIQNVLKQIRVRKVLRPIFFASLSRFLCVLYSILVLCALFFACRIQLLTSRRRHEVALPFACQFAVYWTLRMYTFYPVMWMMCVRALTHSPLVYTRILLLFTHKIDFFPPIQCR